MIVGLKLPPNRRRPQAGWPHHLPSSESRLSEVFEQPTTAEDLQGGEMEITNCHPAPLFSSPLTTTPATSGATAATPDLNHAPTPHLRRDTASLAAGLYPYLRQSLRSAATATRWAMPPNFPSRPQFPQGAIYQTQKAGPNIKTLAWPGRDKMEMVA